MKEKIPNWLKLDNAATIYPSTLSRKYAAMFRVSMTLKDKIDKDVLQCALNNVIDRFPTFKYKLKQGLFWCYFKRIKDNPIIEQDYNNPMLRIKFKNHRNYLFRVRYYENRIAVEFFHALTDGTGAIIFISTLVGESLYILSIQELYNKEHKKKNKEVKISIPVNLRNYYKSNTMRNFSSYVNVGIDTIYGNYSLEEIIKIVKNTLELNLTEKMLNAKISANVKIAKNYFIRLLPMFIKKHIMSFTEKMMGDRYCSNTLSNLGNIVLPKEVEKYVLEMGIAIGKSRGKPASSAMVGYNGNLYITITRKIKEAEFERILFTTLVEMGVPVLIESNRRL